MHSQFSVHPQTQVAVTQEADETRPPMDERGEVHIIFGPDNANLRDQT
jgi:hypothetical protein